MTHNGCSVKRPRRRHQAFAAAGDIISVSTTSANPHVSPSALLYDFYFHISVIWYQHEH